MHYAIKLLGGWLKATEELGTLTTKEREFWGRNFKTLYLMGEKKASWNNVPRYFKGLYEQDNAHRGFIDYVPDVCLVGTGKTVKHDQLPLPQVSPIGELAESVAKSAKAEK